MIKKISIPPIDFENSIIQNVIQNCNYAIGPHVLEFEERLCKLLNFKYAVATSSGFASLFITIKALGLVNSKIIVPSVSTCHAIINSVISSGNIPVFCDIDFKDFSLSKKKIQQIIAKENIAAIIAPSHFGIPAPIGELKKFNIPIIEDACQAFLTRTIEYSNADFSVHSFYPTKHFNCIEGGLVLTNSNNYFEKLKELRYYENQIVFSTAERFNFKMQNFNAAIGLSNFEKIYLHKEKLLKIKSRLLSSDFISKRVPKLYQKETIIPWRFVLKLTSKEKSSIEKAGIAVENELIKLNYDGNEKKNELKDYFAIPFHHSLTQIEINHILKTLNKLYE